MIVLNSSTYFTFFNENLKTAFYANNNQDEIIFAISKRIFSLIKLIPASLGLVVGTVFWIREYIIDKMYPVYEINVLRRENPEVAQVAEIDTRTAIDQTFITFPYWEISRLGDYAKFYLNAKWIAQRLNAQILIRPFPNSSQLKISENHHYHLKNSQKKRNFNELTKEQAEQICRGELTKADLGPGIFTVPRFWDWSPGINWSENEELRREYADDFQPASGVDLSIISPVEGKVNIAIQVREGGTFDNLQDKFLYPARFPDLSYYEAQLEYALNLPEYQNQPVNVALFTDAVDRESLKTRFDRVAAGCGRSHEVTITYRNTQMDADDAILSDLISMAKFPIFIRASSGFSDLSSFLGQPKLEICPHRSALRQEGVAYIDQVIVHSKGDGWANHAIRDVLFEKRWPQEGGNGEFARIYQCHLDLTATHV